MVGVGETPHTSKRWQRPSAQSDAAFVDAWDEIVDGLARQLKAAPADVAIPAAQRYQSVFQAIELAKLAEHNETGGSDRDTRKKASAGGTRTRKAASKTKKRADAVIENPALLTDVENGELGEEQLDAIASASEKSGGDAANDVELVEKVKNAPADDAGKITSRWLERRDDHNSGETRYQRQRSRRSVRFSHDAASGCDQITARGDRESINEIRQALKRAADRLYRKDGGRDLPAGQHPRTREQRLYDALHSKATQANTTGTGRSASGSSSGVQPVLHVGFTVDAAAEAEIRAHLFGGDGYLPAGVLARYGCFAMIAGSVYSQSGEMLWHGREKRYATPAQATAVIGRDQTCTICHDADPNDLHIHHLMPFNAPGRGETNVEDLAAVCGDCHHWLHDEHFTLYRKLGPPDPATGQPTFTWHTRPATPDEIAPRHQHTHAA